MSETLSQLNPFFAAGIALGLSIVLGVVVHFVFWFTIRQFASKTSTVLDDALLKHLKRPTLFIFPTLVLQFLFPVLKTRLPEALSAIVADLITILLILFIAWLLIRVGNVIEDALFQQYRIDVKDNLRARQIRTQTEIIKKVINFLVTVLALGAILMTFDEVRQLGAGLLASAGVAGLVIGLAAQRSLGNLLAGIQLAITQPIRIDDVVIVENEWGRIEEITLTYVVVRIWDLRRLILPISYFIEKPFQNWTRTSADILGTIYIYTDYTVPVEEIRKELKRIVEKSDDWDGKVQGVQVTNTSHEGIEVRALISSSDASKAWNLRCKVRESLVDYLQKNYPQSLSRVRAEVHEMRHSDKQTEEAA